MAMLVQYDDYDSLTFEEFATNTGIPEDLLDTREPYSNVGLFYLCPLTYQVKTPLVYQDPGKMHGCHPVRILHSCRMTKLKPHWQTPTDTQHK